MKARKKWRIYADNNIEQEIIRYLEEDAGFDVLAASEDPRLRHLADESHYQKARQLRRYILSHDDDFWDDRRFPLHDSPGVIIIPKNEEGTAKLFPVLLRKIVERDYNIDNGARSLGGVKIRMTWDGLTHKARLPDGTVHESMTFSWIDLGYKRR